MNFLGHLYFSKNDHDLMIANLFGDSVKGKKYLQYSKKIQDGVLLHRRIDYYIDNHPSVKALRLNLYQELPKIAGIAIDLYFDHLLAIHWNNYHDKPLELFLDDFYNFRAGFEKELGHDFSIFLNRLRTKQWINHYPTFYGLEKLCLGVSNRISFKNNLHLAPLVFKKKNHEIEAAFLDFMQDAVKDLAK